jgi:hypothetical protein
VFGSQILDIAIGLGFIYLIFALACTALNELIAGWRDHRMEHLARGISNLLDRDNKLKCSVNGKEESVIDLFYRHPLIKALNENGTRPSYIPPATFARTMVDLVAPTEGAEIRDKEFITKRISENLKDNSDLQRVLLSMVGEIKEDISELNDKLESWFDDTMDRVSGWYKRHTQKVIFILSLVLVLLANADSIQIAKQLANNPVLRQAMVVRAEQVVADPNKYTVSDGNSEEVGKEFEKVTAEIMDTSKLGLSLGWQGDGLTNLLAQNGLDSWRVPQVWAALLSKFTGLFITVLAASLGAPFWFDMLNKIMSVRSVGKSPRENTAAKS